MFRSSVDVFEARIAPGFITSSSVLKTCSLTFMSSNTASMTRSASFRSSYFNAVESSFMRSSSLSCLSLPFLTWAS